MSNTLIDGPIPSELVQKILINEDQENNVGAQSFFMGHIRNDHIKNQAVAGILYSAYEPMAIKSIDKIKEDAKSKFKIDQIQIFHSIGLVKNGEASLLVVTSAKHRRASIESMDWAVEAIKASVPVFGKEIFNSGEYQWKKNQ